MRLGAESHDVLDAGAVVPGAIEEDHFAGGGEVGHVALEVPLGLLAPSGRGQGDDAADAGVESFRDALDGAALAGGIAAFKQHHDTQAFMADPLLELDQFDLEAGELAVVVDVGAEPQGGVFGRAG